MGGDSLAAVKLTKLINEQFHSNISVQDLYNYSNTTELSKFLFGNSIERTINWQEEVDTTNFVRNIALRLVLMQLKRAASSLIRNTEGDILLTGVTGFLGIHLLYELIQHKDLLPKKVSHVNLKL